MPMKTELAAKIEARNTANRLVNELASTLQVSFAPLVGKKIMKVGGGLLEKYKSLVPDTLPGAFNIYCHNSGYSLGFIVRTCVNYGDHSCTYDEAVAYVGNLNNGVLTEMIPLEPLRCDYTEAEILSARNACAIAEKALNDAKNKLAGFGTYERH